MCVCVCVCVCACIVCTCVFACVRVSGPFQRVMLRVLSSLKGPDNGSTALHATADAAAAVSL